jgi:hypothetical protein
MQTITKPVSLALILLWTHERGELSNKTITDAAAAPMGTLVDAAGAPIDPEAGDWAPTQAYGVHMANGQVYWANSVFNDKYIQWPATITDGDKAAVMAHLETQFLIIKQV